MVLRIELLLFPSSLHGIFPVIIEGHSHGRRGNRWIEWTEASCSLIDLSSLGVSFFTFLLHELEMKVKVKPTDPNPRRRSSRLALKEAKDSTPAPGASGILPGRKKARKEGGYAPPVVPEAVNGDMRLAQPPSGNKRKQRKSGMPTAVPMELETDLEVPRSAALDKGVKEQKVGMVMRRKKSSSRKQVRSWCLSLAPNLRMQDASQPTVHPVQEGPGNASPPDHAPMQAPVQPMMPLPGPVVEDTAVVRWAGFLFDFMFFLLETFQAAAPPFPPQQSSTTRSDDAAQESQKSNTYVYTQAPMPTMFILPPLFIHPARFAAAAPPSYTLRGACPRALCCLDNNHPDPGS
jgi:hypothetical protein